MYFDDNIDRWMGLLCDCETYFECEWHKRLKERYVDRRELEEEMEAIVRTSQAIDMGVIEPPPGWGLMKGLQHYYWRPPR